MLAANGDCCIPINGLPSILTFNIDDARLVTKDVQGEDQNTKKGGEKKPKKAEPMRDCRVSTKATIHPTATGSKSVIGAGCNIDANTKIINCLIFPNAVIRFGATLTNSIIGENAVVGSGTTLRDCRVGNGFQVPDKETHTGADFQLVQKEVNFDQ